MAKQSIISGAFNGFYVGLANQASTPLTQILNVGTGGYKLSYEVPRDTFVACLNTYLQSGAAKITMEMSFISDDPQAFCLAMGNWLTANQDDAPSGSQYSILLLDSINTNGSSLFIPICESVTKWDLDRAKLSQTQIALQFRWQNSDTATKLFYKRSNSLLKTVMQNQSPY